jgi:hypothetical protein
VPLVCIVPTLASQQKSAADHPGLLRLIAGGCAADQAAPRKEGANSLQAPLARKIHIRREGPSCRPSVRRIHRSWLVFSLPYSHVAL